MLIYFATGNNNKLKEFRNALAPSGIEIEHIDIDYPEIRSDDIEEIAKSGAIYVSNKTDKPVIVEDTGLFIGSLNGFPGAYTKWVHQKIGHEGLFRLLEEKDRRAEFRTCIAFSEPGREPVTFIGIAKGTLILEERGKEGWGHDPIFIPEGYDRTWAQDPELKSRTSHRARAIEKFREWLKKKR
ncbi:MAG: XTP/dITP diphosphatase [archaeon]